MKRCIFVTVAVPLMNFIPPSRRDKQLYVLHVNTMESNYRFDSKIFLSLNIKSKLNDLLRKISKSSREEEILSIDPIYNKITIEGNSSYRMRISKNPWGSFIKRIFLLPSWTTRASAHATNLLLLLLLLLRGDRYSLSAICFAGFPGEKERERSLRSSFTARYTRLSTR